MTTTALAVIQPDELDTIQRTKVCSACKQELATSEFHRNKSKGDGYNSYCKRCVVEYKRSYRDANREHINALQRQNYHRNAEKKRELFRAYRRDNRERVRETARQWRERNPEYMKRWNASYAANHSVKIKAKTAVNNAVADGKIIPIGERQCEICGGQAQEYHHWSYEPENWLDVMPLCAPCHKSLHFQMKSEDDQDGRD